MLYSDDEALRWCVVEAMAIEVPLIVSDSGGTHERPRLGRYPEPSTRSGVKLVTLSSEPSS